MLSPVRAPTELADERSAISADLSDATSVLSSKQLESSLQPLRESKSATHPVIEEHSDEAVWLFSVLTDLKEIRKTYKPFLFPSPFFFETRARSAPSNRIGWALVRMKHSHQEILPQETFLRNENLPSSFKLPWNLTKKHLRPRNLTEETNLF